MRPILTTRKIEIPNGIYIQTKSRKIIVSGKIGCIVNYYKHILIDIKKEKKKNLRFNVWFGNRKKVASLTTITSHISNLFIGVTVGFSYKMRSVYAHFPINIEIKEKGRLVEIRNFLGERRVRKIKLPFEVKCEKSENTKDEIIIKGNDLKTVSLGAASIQQLCLVKNKDIRKFLDGIYVSKKLNN
ncbi:rpl9 (nucleomorph) [Hemiselmis andersenii]|uniref:Rpl9 n=1 Tax=Hemiselmis andersenii TaxID=464988 RepID=A9BKK7_HEMAN|nr:rpl9 [Hemiselmis andersenii]XP_001712503.1 rpl9 [Hemiselmis andersenii]ABW98017.1 rpl9 [Hemiselmis andersenii]ABW98178.1 rpl9 [Hemiselmis andersenii]|mmetsp:Transcript_39948/g.93556  ORF Transcript_39948/g.93556 Transcript_39948/m.93556 type:complete len:186 (+) Transcript_39948:2903-3460(+)